MKCPVCPEVNLTMSDRQGIEIDYCPQCRGVWLDRGELDKLIERSGAASAIEQQPVRRDDREDRDDRHASYQQHSSGHYKHKKKNLLGELFDF